MALRRADPAAAVVEDSLGAAEKGEPDIAREWAKLQSLLSRAEEMADRIAPLLAGRAIGVADTPAPPSAPDGQKPVGGVADPEWRALALPGVGRLEARSISRWKVAVSIDGAEEFALTPNSADLLSVLADGEPDEDGFPRVRPYPELAAAYSARTGRPAGVRAVVVGIGRLRQRLRTAGNVSPRLVETIFRKGARFRIRRRTTTSHAHDRPPGVAAAPSAVL